MSTIDTGAGSCGRDRRPHAEAAIVFGSAATIPARKPASVRATCEAIGLPRSTYYYQSHRSAPAVALEQKIVLRLHELRKQYPDDGYRRMTQRLLVEGFHVNRKRIARLMQLHSLTTRTAKPDRGGFYRSRGPVPSSLESLQERTRLTGPHRVWIADIAYVHIRSCLVYAAAIVDLWSREVVGYAASLQITNRLASIALHSAVRAHRPAQGCIHHSTTGAQYSTRGYCELLRQYGLIPSVGDAINQLSPRSLRTALGPGSRQVIEMAGYDTWEDVIRNTREFILALYTSERINWILDRRLAEGQSAEAVPGEMVTLNVLSKESPCPPTLR